MHLILAKHSIITPPYRLQKISTKKFRNGAMYVTPLFLILFIPMHQFCMCLNIWPCYGVMFLYVTSIENCGEYICII